MSGETTTTPATRRSSEAIVMFSDGMPSFSDSIFGFLVENHQPSENFSDDSFENREWEDEEEEEENSTGCEEKKVFWDEQEKLLQGILCRTSSIESRVRNATKEAMRLLEGSRQCGCRRQMAIEECRDCLRREIRDSLCNAGFNCSIRNSKWKSSPEIPQGKHTYLEVTEKSQSSNGGEMKVIIELNFRAEFEMARASQEYNKLIRRLPEIYVGKPERLRNLIKILCGAAKKYMKEKKMHIGPWRKHKYMQAKWLSSTFSELINTTTSSEQPMEARYLDRSKKPKTSMLTLSLVENLSEQLCQAVAVV